MSTATVKPHHDAEPFPGYELIITRVLDAPRELVWEAWTDPAMQMQWLGPRGFKTTDVEMPKTPGAPWRRTMEGMVPSTGARMTLKQHGTLKEIKPPELLVFSFSWDLPSDSKLRNMEFEENTITVRLEEKGKQTVMTFTQGPFLTKSASDGHTYGWNSCFDKLIDFLVMEQPSRRTDPNELPTELHVRNYYEAPRDLVFVAWTTPEKLAQWWGPKGFTIPNCEWEARAGGKIYIEMRAPDGIVYPMSGRVMEFYAPYRFHFTTTPLDPQGSPLFELWISVFFEQKNDGTEMALDVHLMSMTEAAPTYLKGLKEGWHQSLEKLANLLRHSVQPGGIA